MGPVGLVFGAELRRRWKSWLALAGLIALVGGLVLDAVATGSRTSSAFSRFVAAHGFDAIAFNDKPTPGLARLPEVASEIHASAPANGPLRCACSQKIASANFLLASVSARDLPRVVKLLSGRMPHPSKPDEVLASFTLQQLGLHVGSVVHVPTYTPAQTADALNSTGSPRGPVLALHVVGIEAAELEFPTGAAPSYDIWGTQALAASARPRSLIFDAYFVRLHHGAQDLPRFNADARSMHVLFSVGESAAADAVKTSIHPQAVGWWVLALLAGLAGLVVVGQAIGRQNVVESGEYPTLATLGLVPRQLVRLGMARNLTVAVAGAVGAVILATVLSPLTPVGEARQADPSVGLSFDALVLLLGALAIVAIVFLLGLWPAVRASHLDHGQVHEAAVRPSAIVTSLSAAGAPPSAVIGIRHALARGRGRATVPVGTALFGTVLAVMALCGTAVFGASLTRLTHTPALYGDPYQFEVTGFTGSADLQPLLTGLLTTLKHDRTVTRITLGTSQEIAVNGRTVDVLAGTPIRGTVLLSMVGGNFPKSDDQIALGSTTMHQVGAHIGSLVKVSMPGPAGGTTTAPFRVVAGVSIPGDVGSGGLGTGAAMTMHAYVNATCPPGPTRPKCQAELNQSINYAVLVGTVPGPRGQAAVARYLDAYRSFSASGPITPTSLVNFGEAINFPLILGVVLALFGAATLLHLLVVSVVRRRREMGLLKSLGFVNAQVIAAVCWQATTIAVVGIVIGVPLGVALGQVAWRAFATNLGVVPYPSVPVVLIAALVGGVLVIANLLAIAPAWAARSQPAGDLLRAQQQ